MLEIINPAVATNLTTPERARAALGHGNVDDPAVIDLIPQASRAIVDHCRRSFAIETVRETFADNDLAGPGPMLGRDPLVEVISLISNGDALTPSLCRVDSRTGRLVRLDTDGRILPWWGGSLVIEYQAGYVLPTDDSQGTLPASVERAAIMLLSSYLSVRSRDPLVKSESVEGIGSTSWWVPGESDRVVSPETAQLLAPYVRFYP